MLVYIAQTTCARQSTAIDCGGIIQETPMTLPHHRYIIARGWVTLGLLAFWLGVVLLLARCA